MITSSNAISDSEENELHPASEHSSTVDTNISNKNWVDITIAEEINRGNKLRQEKPLTFKGKDAYPVIINIKQPRNTRKKHKRKNKKSANQKTPCGCSYWPIPSLSTTISPSITQPNSTRIKFRIKPMNEPRCPMRIAELAVPTKRHCIDTWRNKSYLLPGFMVDRLRQHVMDQRPIVQIPEAIRCFRKFKRRTPKTSKSANNNLNIRTPLRLADTKTLCFIFAHKILQRLSKPLIVSLNEDLQKLSNIVGNDVDQIIKSKKHTGKKKVNSYKQRAVRSDVINKITVWIADILQDYTYKILEEDLKDLEEEEGPVLDFLDDVIDYVLKICEPEPSIIDIEEESSSSRPSSEQESEDIESLQSLEDKLTDSEHFRNELNDIINNLLTDEEYLQNEIHNILNNIIQQCDEQLESDRFHSPSGDDLTDKEYFENLIYNVIGSARKDSEDDIADKDSEKSVNISEQFERNDKPITTEIDIVDTDFGNIESNEEAAVNDMDNEFNIETEERDINDRDEVTDQNIVESYVENTELNEVNEEGEVHEVKGLENVLIDEGEVEQKHTNVSDTNVSDWSKKVTFSSTDMVKARQIESSGLREIVIRPNSEVQENSQLNINNENSTKRNVVFGPPNTHLLSDADEVWPDFTFAHDVLKPSASVTQSITSLGKLSEIDEKISQADYISIAGRDDFTYEKLPSEVKAMDSLVKIFQDDETHLIENNSHTAGKLTPLNAELPNVDVINSIAALVNKIQNEKLLTPAVANAFISEELTKLNVELPSRDVDEIIKTIEDTLKNSESHLLTDTEIINSIQPILNHLQHSEITLPTTGDHYLQNELKVKEETLQLHDLVIDKCDVKVQTDQLLTPKRKVLGTTGITVTSVAPSLLDDEVFDKNKNIPEHEKTNEYLRYKWKVELKRVPSWVTQANAHGEPSENSMILPVSEPPVKLTSSYIRQWCNDLDIGFRNLEIWRDWLQKTCKETNYLLRKKNTCMCPNKKYTRKWITLQKNLTADAVLMREIKQRTLEKFDKIRHYRGNIKVISSKHTGRCICKNTTRFNKQKSQH